MPLRQVSATAAPRTPTSSQTLRIGAVTAAGIGILGLAVFAIGGAGTLALGSTWLLASAVGRLVPSFRGPTAWAAGVLGEVALVLGASGVLALVSPHAHGRAVHLAILLFPALVAAALLLAERRAAPARAEGAPPSRWEIALPITAGTLAAAATVAVSGPLHGLAWATSGDARNHTAIMRGLLADGGVTIGGLREWPAVVNGFAAILAGTGARGGSLGEVLLVDLQALATTYVLAGIAVAALTAGALIETLPVALRAERRASPAVVGTLLVAAASAGSPFVLGTALGDGFLSSYGTLPLALAAIVLSLRTAAGILHRILTLVLLSVATLITFVSWPLLVVVPGTVLLVTAAHGSVLVARSTRRRQPALGRAETALLAMSSAVGLAAAGAVVVAAVSTWPRLEAAFVLPGSAAATLSVMVPALGLVALAMVLSDGSRGLGRQLAPTLAVVGTGALTVWWLLHLSGDGLTWTYYALKTNWLVAASLLWLAFLPGLIWLSHQDRVARRGAPAAGAVALATAVLLVVGSAATSASPLRAMGGWSSPSAEVLAKVVESADRGAPFVFWQWAGGDDDRLGNFWAALAWSSQPDGTFIEISGLPGGFATWAYGSTGQSSELCSLIEAVPGIVVHTRSSTLEAEVSRECPSGTPLIEVSPLDGTATR